MTYNIMDQHPNLLNNEGPWGTMLNSRSEHNTIQMWMKYKHANT